jgi:hypothetical protein
MFLRYAQLGPQGQPVDEPAGRRDLRNAPVSPRIH